jgi:hypothetical protein
MQRWAICLVAAGLAQGLVGAAQAQQGAVPKAVQVTLKDQLEKALRARRPQEFAAIGQVLKGVEQGVLPLDIVQTSFNWSRKKRANRVQYFILAVNAQARRRGVDFHVPLR